MFSTLEIPSYYNRFFNSVVVFHSGVLRCSKLALIWTTWYPVPWFVSGNFVLGDSEESWPWPAMEHPPADGSGPPSGMREKIRRAKVREKLVGWDQDGLNEGCDVGGSMMGDAKTTTCYLPQAVGCPASLWTMTALENSNPWVFCQAWCYVVWNFYLIYVGQLTQLWPLLIFCPPLSSLLVRRGRAVWESKTTLMLCKHYSAIAEILMCYQHGFGHIWYHMGCRDEN